MRALPPLLILLSGGLLGFFWDALPPRWARHFDAAGQPDGWGEPSLVSVFFPLVAALAIWILLEFVARWIGKRGTATPIMAGGQQAMIRWVSLGVVLDLCGIAVLLPLAASATPLSISPLPVVLLPVLLAVAIGFVQLGLAGRRSKAAAEPVPKGYNAFGYYNQEDPRLIVPKLYGVGATFNFAKRSAWLILALLLLAPLVGIGTLLLNGLAAATL